jgi:hypothetical protein
MESDKEVVATQKGTKQKKKKKKKISIILLEGRSTHGSSVRE